MQTKTGSPSPHHPFLCGTKANIFIFSYTKITNRSGEGERDLRVRFFVIFFVLKINFSVP